MIAEVTIVDIAISCKYPLKPISCKRLWFKINIEIQNDSNVKAEIAPKNGFDSEPLSTEADKKNIEKIIAIEKAYILRFMQPLCEKKCQNIAFILIMRLKFLIFQKVFDLFQFQDFVLLIIFHHKKLN